MKKKFILFLIIVVVSYSTGCWSRREVNQLAITTAIGIDKSEEGYLITVQLINSGEVASEKATQRTAVTTYRTTGKTVFEAMRRLTLETPQKIYNAHLRLLVFSEEFAKEGIEKTVDFFSRDHEFRSNFLVIVAKDIKAEKLLNILSPVEQIPADKIFYSLKISSDAWASTYTVQLDDLVDSLLLEGINPVLTGVIVNGNPEVGMDMKNLQKVDPPTTIQIRRIAGFKEDKLVGWLNEEESIGFKYIMGDVKSTVITIPCANIGKVGVELIRTKTDSKGKVESGKPIINVEIWCEGNIGELECKIDLLKNEIIDSIETEIEEKIKNEIEAAIYKAQNEFKSDIFGFGEVIHRADPKAWQELKKDWNKEFEDIEVNVKVTAKIRRIGTITY